MGTKKRAATIAALSFILMFQSVFSVVMPSVSIQSKP